MSYINNIDVGGQIYEIKDTTGTFIAPEESSHASAYYAVGAYLTYNGVLYHVGPSAIAAGDALTVGTNITEVPNGIGTDVAGLKRAIKDTTGMTIYSKSIGGFVAETDGKTYTDASNRIRINEYIGIDDVVSASQPSGYWLYYYVYDETLNRIYNTPTWRQATTPLLFSDIKAQHPTAAFIHLMMRSSSNAPLPESDKDKLVITQAAINKDQIDEIENTIHNTITPNAMPVRLHETNNQIQGMVKVKNEFWVFSGASDDHTGDAGKIYVFNTDFDAQPTIRYHNLGHASSLYYNSFCDCLFVSNIIINGFGGIGYFKNASQKTDLYISDADFVFIPISTITTRSYTITQGDAWNTLYVIYQNTIYHYLMKTANDNTFSGEIELIDNNNFPSTDETVQGIIFANGKFLRLTGVEETHIDIISFVGNDLKKERMIEIKSYSSDGENYKLEPEGIEMDGQTLYITQWDVNPTNPQFWVKKIQ